MTKYDSFLSFVIWGVVILSVLTAIYFVYRMKFAVAPELENSSAHLTANKDPPNISADSFRKRNLDSPSIYSEKGKTDKK